MARKILIRSLFSLMAFSFTTSAAVHAQSWRIYSVTSQPGPNIGWSGFPYRFNRYIYNITTYNSGVCDPDRCPGEGLAKACSIGIRQLYGGGFLQSYFYAPNDTYWDYQAHSVGKILYDGTNRFRNPAEPPGSPLYKFFMMFASSEPCGRNGYGTAFSQNGLTFVHGQQANPLLAECDDVPCTTFNWWCDNGWPCDTASPRQWWTSAEILAPLTYTDGNMYAAGALFIRPNAGDCSQENSLCWPTNPLHAGTAAYLLRSPDGITWSRVYEPNGEYGRITKAGIDTARPCYGAAWLINLDLAYEPGTDYFYMTRSYATDYGETCDPGKLPDRIQLYRTRGASGVFYGPWELLFDGGCYNLGFQPDSASIVHDGVGNALVGGDGSIQLMISSSHDPAVCTVSPYPYHTVVVGP